MDATTIPGQDKCHPQTKRTKAEHTQDAKAPGRCLIGTLPLELLVEILSYTTPRDILALSRTSKYFYATLVTNPASGFIWKKARARYEPAIPNPTPNFTEPSYAALLFDTGPCEWIPRMECVNFGYPRYSMTESPQDAVDLLMRRRDWLEAVDEYNKAALSELTMAEYIEEKNSAVKNQQAFMELAKELIKWRNGCSRLQVIAFDHNLKLARAMAAKQGWVVWDLLQTSSFGTLYRKKNKDAERIHAQEFENIETSVAADILRMVEKRKRRRDENDYRERRKDVGELYGKLKKTECKDTPLPPLTDFRKLPTVQRIQYKPSKAPSAAVAGEFKHSHFVAHLINEELVQWRDNARTGLGRVLGFNASEQLSPGNLHPVDRLTARFRCKECDNKGLLRGWDNVSFDFSGACQHRCRDGTRERVRESWKAENFAPDSGAIDIVERLLVRLGCAADDERTAKIVASLGSRIICLSCRQRIRMDFRTLLYHCYRHESMQFDIVPETVSADDQPIEYGLRAKLVAPTSGAERQRRIYFCRHCPPPGDVSQALAAIAREPQDHTPDKQTSAATSRSAAEDGSTRENAAEVRPPRSAARPRQKQPKVLNFDGLRSHVKDKHGIEWIGDEDFYRVLPDIAPVTLTLS
ncbi:uncharacterized protein PHACADRAFT_206959 [Phanerochaete carnosa HHB-10118-sp]|uniref:F-box domain-containing protein n=1 Tax=Phanerochaete carnosa (strain HHB-10118-sp) TaxID=650164 RepID=K5WFN5_PHACS|nr:uncharacterized protein PHACADRAFT_206959 [Phanerochaete carnosa HHB-10118-sp]EKM58120.1 hypothetical protein PHACADRAFT_206959 [Phanerochaete carnosa HHB-10118-sp]